MVEAPGADFLRDGVVMTASRTRDIDALRVGADVGGNEEESGVVENIVEQGDIEWGQALKLLRLVGGGGLALEGEPQPETLGTGTGEEGAAGKSLRVHGIVEIEVANVADVFDFGQGNLKDTAGEIQ